MTDNQNQKFSNSPPCFQILIILKMIGTPTGMPIIFIQRLKTYGLFDQRPASFTNILWFNFN